MVELSAGRVDSRQGRLGLAALLVVATGTAQKGLKMETNEYAKLEAELLVVAATLAPIVESAKANTAQGGTP